MLGSILYNIASLCSFMEVILWRAKTLYRNRCVRRLCRSTSISALHTF